MNMPEREAQAVEKSRRSQTPRKELQAAETRGEQERWPSAGKSTPIQFSAKLSATRTYIRVTYRLNRLHVGTHVHMEMCMYMQLQLTERGHEPEGE